MLGGRYRLIRPIARGGMAEVWEGYDEVLSRPVAVKVLHGHLAEDGVFLERFRREAVTAARLAHPGVVATFDTGIDDRTAYIVMELVRGRTLRQLLTERGPLEPWLAVAITRQIADALIYAHQAGLVHRDIKPANVLLTDDEWGGLRVKVTDFGIAKASSGSGGDLTRTGTVLGTPKYLSPEQIKGDEPDARADLYSLGVVLFEMLTGAPPFVGSTDMTTALAHLNDRVPRVSSRSRPVPPALDRLVADLLVKDPERRVPSAAALRQRLDALALKPPAGASPTGRKSRRRQRDATVVLERGAATAGVAGGRGTLAAPPVAPTAVLTTGGDGTRSAPGDGAVFRGNVARPPDAGPTTDPLAAVSNRPASPRRARTPGLIVLALVIAVAVVMAILLVGRNRRPTASAHGSGSAASVHITSVSPFMVNGRPPDDPTGLAFTFDGNPATYWQSDDYHDATFDNLYPGMGLAIQLSASAALHHLVVTSPTVGWAAQTYVSSTSVAGGQPVSAWGGVTDSQSDIAGSATFSLGGRNGQWVLLWLTRLGSVGSYFQIRINDLSIN
jgi:serine/threonine-protein kinase